MEKKILSIVVPSYNAEKFLDRSIPSMLIEDILSDIEILIVDDGSKDNTGEIADLFEAKYPNTIKAVHKENGGHGSTINTGISIASGKYFCVLDADDWMDSEKFKELVFKLKKIDSDLVLFDFNYVSEDNKILHHKKFKSFPVNKEFLLENYITKIPVLANNQWIGIHNYCIKTNILFDNQVRLHEHHFYVDQEYILYSLCYVKTVTYLNITVRNYLYGYNEQSSSVKSKQKNYLQYKEVIEYLINFYKEKKSNLSLNYRKYYCRHIAWFNSGLYSTYLSFPYSSEVKNELYKFDKSIKSNALDVFKANRNIAILALRITKFSLFRFGAVLYKKIFVK